MDSVTTGNKKTTTLSLSDETLGTIGMALWQRFNDMEATEGRLKSVGLSHEYFSEQRVEAEKAITEFYAARNGA